MSKQCEKYIDDLISDTHELLKDTGELTVDIVLKSSITELKFIKSMLEDSNAQPDVKENP